MIPRGTLKYHTDAIPGLSWNILQRAALLTASVDQQAAVWNLQTGQTVAVFDLGAPGKTAEWNPVSNTDFCIGSDAGVIGFDVRSGKTFQFGGEISAFRYGFDGIQIFCSFEVGFLSHYDIRNFGEPISHVLAHQGPINDLAVCKVRNVVASVGEDSFCKIWEISSNANLEELKMGEGPLFGAEFCPDIPTLLAVCGDIDGGTKIWNIQSVFD